MSLYSGVQNPAPMAQPFTAKDALQAIRTPSLRGYLVDKSVPWDAVDLAMGETLPQNPQDRTEFNLLVGGSVVRLVYRAATARWYQIGGASTLDALPADPSEGDEVNVLVDTGVYTRVAYVNGAWMQVGPAPTVATLPTTLAASIPNLTVSYVADDTNGVEWMLRYDSTEATYPWHYVGGPPLFSEVTTDQGTTSTSYTDLGTVGPDATLPLGGDYDVEIGAGLYSVAGTVAAMSYAIGGVGASDSNNISYNSTATGVHSFAVRRKTGATAGTLLRMKYKTTTGTSQFFRRTFRVWPVRVAN